MRTGQEILDNKTVIPEEMRRTIVARFGDAGREMLDRMEEVGDRLFAAVAEDDLPDLAVGLLGDAAAAIAIAQTFGKHQVDGE